MRIEKSDLKNYVGKKIRLSYWDREKVFTPNFVGKTLMVGDTGLSNETFYALESCQGYWETYNEPKHQVKMWQALIKNDNESFYSTVKYYASLKSARDHSSDNVIMLLPHTEIEVEV